jgi:hypothetical protein
MRRGAAIATAVLAWLAPVLSTATAQDAAERLAILQRRAADRSLSIREREAAADEAIQARAALIAAAGRDEPRLPGWLSDQGAALLSRLGRDGSDTQVLFGLPTQAQRAGVAEAASQAAALLARAAASAPEGSEAAAAAPFFRARALVLMAAAEDGPQRRQLAADAHKLVADLALASAGPESMRRIVMGAALLMRAVRPDPEDARAALEELLWAATGGRETGALGAAPSIVPASLRVEGWLGFLHATGVLGTLEDAVDRVRGMLSLPPFAADGRPDPLMVVLAHDAMTRALFERGIRTGQPRLLQRALDVQEELLARRDLGFDAESLRPLALEKLALLAQRAPGQTLPAGFRLAAAVMLARQPSQRAEAISALAALADDPGSGPAAADALWELAVLLTQDPGTSPRLRAVRALVRLAASFPDSRRASEAISAALAYARALSTQDPTDAAVRSAYREALRLGTETYQDLPDRALWRYERVRLALESHDRADLATALAHLRHARAGDPLAAESTALAERGQGVLLDGLFEELAALRRAGDATAASVLARTSLVPEARAAADWATAMKLPSAPRFRADLGQALTEAGDPGGAAIFRALLASPAAPSLPGGTAALKLGLARALLLSGEATKAFPLLSEIATALDAPPVPGDPPPGTPARVETFWHAWTLMLETLAASEQRAAQAGAIRAHIRRLRAIDPELGGEPWKSRIGRIAGQLPRVEP